MTRVFTLGHSDRTFAEVLQLLDDHDINALVDVRRFPSSREHPQWNQSSIVEALPAGYSYTWVSELGGRRHTPRGVPSPNGGWHVKAFQDYADHMLGEEFAHGLDQLIDLSRDALSVVMCSEAVPWRCHRRLITDALTLGEGCRFGEGTLWPPEQLRAQHRGLQREAMRWVERVEPAQGLHTVESIGDGAHR
jgi:uncharacterized protein (DUF488 family)